MDTTLVYPISLRSFAASIERVPEAQYRRLAYEHLRELRRRSGLGALALDPAGA